MLLDETLCEHFGFIAKLNSRLNYGTAINL